jgi:hypothetical protein
MAHIPRKPHNIYWHKNRGACWAQISEKENPYMSVQTCTEFEGRTVHKLWAHFSRSIGTSFKVLFLLGIPYSLSRNLAQESRQSIQHLLLGQPYSVRISGTEIEEHF